MAVSPSGLDSIRMIIESDEFQKQFTQNLVKILKDKIGSPHNTVVSLNNLETLALEYAQAVQRFTLLLTLVSHDELKRIGLLPADFIGDDEEMRAHVTRELNDRVKQFNEAHARLTGKRKKIPETGSLDLDPSEMQIVAALRYKGWSTQDILHELHNRREHSRADK